MPGLAVPPVYSDDKATQDWVVAGLHHRRHRLPGLQATGGIDAIIREQQPWRERAAALTADPKKVHWIVEMGTERARTIARQTMKDVREAMGLGN